MRTYSHLLVFYPGSLTARHIDFRLEPSEKCKNPTVLAFTQDWNDELDMWGHFSLMASA